MSITLRTIGLFGVLLFGLLFSATFASPETIEKSAKSFVIYQIEKEVRKTYEKLSQSSVADKALGIAGKLGIESDKIKKGLENNLPEKIASTIAAMCGYDCEKKKMIAESITSKQVNRLKNIEIAQNNLGDLIRGKYLEILDNLKLDLRIFVGSNLAMFLILLLISFIKPKAITHLFLPAMLLFLATVISSSLYLFGQDWFYTILYNDYMGFGYLAYIAVIFAVQVDIVFNKAYLTTEIINLILHMVGSTASVMKC